MYALECEPFVETTYLPKNTCWKIVDFAAGTLRRSVYPKVEQFDFGYGKNEDFCH